MGARTPGDSRQTPSGTIEVLPTPNRWLVIGFPPEAEYARQSTKTNDQEGAD